MSSTLPSTRPAPRSRCRLRRCVDRARRARRLARSWARHRHRFDRQDRCRRVERRDRRDCRGPSSRARGQVELGLDPGVSGFVHDPRLQPEGQRSPRGFERHDALSGPTRHDRPESERRGARPRQRDRGPANLVQHRRDGRVHRDRRRGLGGLGRAGCADRARAGPACERPDRRGRTGDRPSLRRSVPAVRAERRRVDPGRRRRSSRRLPVGLERLDCNDDGIGDEQHHGSDVGIPRGAPQRLLDAVAVDHDGSVVAVARDGFGAVWGREDFAPGAVVAGPPPNPEPPPSRRALGDRRPICVSSPAAPVRASSSSTE